MLLVTMALPLVARSYSRSYNKSISTSSKKLLVTRASLLVTRALLLVARSYNKSISTSSLGHYY